mmetsp:Transcript_23402/g.51369  ORF Transcript_23402/g.51369 Transcript_23402/m.51369 type:complete len:453 (+) Transcript_23402:266-1624(+)|eukprot:CAMPEP_0202901554 /NCGR_PEP_ID=MMETSP1392-20130828/14320_1 /ASSEMBLY_ACC=CAM_ASM_000868 /TAXON_ID=225041 /ORGANISM="Chlamydomonas chlamydogama, Strain SAG 11-48b" /LENGTH=452 /DNA_ID=CAMNT_0049588135 /DNA_START=266 /DNA_END=1624 /DNA_ORIENTATION=-
MPKADQELLEAARAGSEDAVRAALQAGAHRSAAEDGSTALHIAAKAGHTQVVCLLLEEGFEVDRVDKDGASALYLAARYNHRDAMIALLERGATPSLACTLSPPPAAPAVRQGHNAGGAASGSQHTIELKSLLAQFKDRVGTFITETTEKVYAGGVPTVVFEVQNRFYSKGLASQSIDELRGVLREAQEYLAAYEPRDPSDRDLRRQLLGHLEVLMEAITTGTDVEAAEEGPSGAGPSGTLVPAPRRPKAKMTDTTAAASLAAEGRPSARSRHTSAAPSGAAVNAKAVPSPAKDKASRKLPSRLGKDQRKGAAPKAKESKKVVSPAFKKSETTKPPSRSAGKLKVQAKPMKRSPKLKRIPTKSPPKSTVKSTQMPTKAAASRHKKATKTPSKGGETYKVQLLLDVRDVEQGKRKLTQYLVKWEGYGPEHNTWEPAANILDKDLIAEFKRSRS